MSSIKRQGAEILSEARAFRESNITRSSVHTFLRSLDTPRALAVWILFDNNEHDQLLALECEPRNYANGYAFRNDYVATSFLSKANFLSPQIDKKKAAVLKFLEYEELCRQTNFRFKHPSSDPQNNGSNVWLLNATRRKIESILGSFSGEEIASGTDWGPGVSTLIKGENASAVNKFSAETGITQQLYSFVRPWFQMAYPLWVLRTAPLKAAERGCFEGGNVIVTVPKNSKTDRVIAVEPGLNLWFQKSAGTAIRRRLRREGIDLQNQQINQNHARRASRSDWLATIDFSSASDSIASAVVEELLPPRWFALLNSMRCTHGKLDSELLKWEKFSSMGNGFTFELESLIFYAAAFAVRELAHLHPDLIEPDGRTGARHIEGPLSVYGDDVILPSGLSGLFASFSAFLGFRVNLKKSFSSGPFRESCGSHYFDGVDCKPIFLKEKLCYVESFYKLGNSVRLLAHRYGFNRSCDVRFLDCWNHLVDRVPEPLRLRTPQSAGDVGFISNFDEASPARAKHGIEGFWYTALSTTAIMRQAEHDGLLLARLWSAPPLALKNDWALRGRAKRLVVRSLVVRWYDLGPWE